MNFTQAKPNSVPRRAARPGLLSWPAWLRMLAMAPVLALLWLAVLWAGMGGANP